MSKPRSKGWPGAGAGDAGLGRGLVDFLDVDHRHGRPAGGIGDLEIGAVDRELAAGERLGEVARAVQGTRDLYHAQIAVQQARLVRVDGDLVAEAAARQQANPTLARTACLRSGPWHRAGRA